MPQMTPEEIQQYKDLISNSPIMATSNIQPYITSTAGLSSGGMIGGIGGGQLWPPSTTTTTAVYSTPPVPNPPPSKQLQVYITPVNNGFLVGVTAYVTAETYFCKDFTEVSEAIVAIMARDKIGVL